jgi:putative ABC transport system permease protein
VRVLLAGLWARRGLNGAALLVTVLALTASLLGPMYARESGEHLLDSRVARQAPFTTGLSLTAPALPEGRLPKQDPDRYQPPRPQELVAQVGDRLRRPDLDRYWLPERGWLLDQGGVLQYGARVFTTPLYWRQGMCHLARVTGRCPTSAREVLVEATMARTMGLGVGDRIPLTFTDKYLHLETPDSSQPPEELQRTRRESFKVVGTYTVPDPGSPAWFDLGRFVGIADLKPPPTSGTGLPATPALLTPPATMTSQTFVGGVDRPIDPAAVNLDTMADVSTAVQRFKNRTLSDQTVGQLDDIDVDTVFGEVRAEHTLLSRVMLAALAPLVVLALLLLYALVASLAQVRRPYVALAKLRGHSLPRVLRFALSEPFLVVALAVPIAVGIAIGGAHLLARFAVGAGTPVIVDATGVVALVAVAAAALAASAAAAVSVIREPLSASLASSVRPGPSSRASLVLRSAVVAVAVAAVAQILTSGDQAGQLLALLTPLFVALAVAVGGVLLLRLAGRWWLGRTAAAGGTASYLAARRLARRQDLLNLMVPLLLAVSVISFAVSASATSDQWRVSRARAEIGAPHVYLTDVSPGRLLHVTRRVDPAGRYLAAAVIDNSGDDLSRRVIMDTTRLSAVAAWDPSWSGEPLPALQRRLEPRSKPITFTGDTVTVHVRDIHLSSRSDPKARFELWLAYGDQGGEQATVRLGDLHNGAGATLSTHVSRCAHGCALQQLFVSGDAQSVTDAQGRLTLSAVQVDGAPAEWGFDTPGAWRAARPFPVSTTEPPVALEVGGSGLRIQVYLGQLPGAAAPSLVSGIARITPSRTPEVLPVLATSGTEAGRPVLATTLDGQQAPARIVQRVTTLPYVGSTGELADLATQLPEFTPPPGASVATQLWTAERTPPALLAAVRGAGVTLTNAQSVDATVHALRTDAFSQGLRVFLGAGIATLLLAIFGVFASAVVSARWRSYEVASLRAVGVSRRSLVRASVLEYVVMLGLAVLLGIVAAVISLTLVLPSISLGNAAAFDPVPTYSLHWLPILGSGLAVLVLAALIALVVSRRTTRLGRPSTLRWAEQG